MQLSGKRIGYIEMILASHHDVFLTEMMNELFAIGNGFELCCILTDTRNELFAIDKVFE